MEIELNIIKCEHIVTSLFTINLKYFSIILLELLDLYVSKFHNGISLGPIKAGLYRVYAF